ncbi:hypothetical protein [Thiohalomonas denitrificans]|uniref:hypothetical protein n=1 Tax=Thiohalomonas denitrificans TaxID=415747 RepID=UPI0026ED852F|nr:hypothetical protein [Thiohalomonas denitrificans]
MKYLRTEANLGEAECSTDAMGSSQRLELQLQSLREDLERLPTDAAADSRMKLLLDSAYVLLDLERREEAWEIAKPVFDEAIAIEDWLRAVEATDVLFQADRSESVKALAHGIWLGVTFPIDPELSVAMLQHMVEETPDNSDGAAVAAAAARYITDLRAEGQQRDDLQFFTMQLLGDVARRHGQVDEQDVFEFWMERLELNEPGKFLPRLAKILDVIVEESWWFDRDALRAKIPEES